MAERPEDLSLPITVVQRLVKEALPEGVIVSKEARHTISRASSVFVLYLTACAVAHANKSKRKTLAVSDILSACGDMEFDSFVPSLNEALKYRKEFLAQNSKKSSVKVTKPQAEDEEDDAEVEIDEPEVAEPEIGEDEINDSKSNDLDVSTGEGAKKKRKLTDTVPTEVVTSVEEENNEIEVEDDSEDSEPENEQPL